MTQEGKYIELSNEIGISYFEKGSSTGIPLILLHGLADSWRIFELLISYFPDSVHIYALSQRGHGDSSRPSHGYSTKDFEEDLRLFMEALNIPQAIIVGASSGGFPARNFAINYPERTLGLVLIGSPATLQNSPAAHEVWKNTLSKLTDPIDKDIVESFAKSSFFGDIPQERIEKVIQENLKVPARVWRSTTAGIMQEAFPAKLNCIKSPTLIIWGKQDHLLTRKSQEELSKVIADSKLVQLKNVGHMLYFEDPEGVATNILLFIEKMQSEI